MGAPSLQSQKAPGSCPSAAPYEGLATQSFADFPTDRLGPGLDLPQAAASRLEARFRELLTEAKAPAGSVTLWRPGAGYWSASAGVAPGGTNAFLYASVTKLITATVVLQLAAEGRLSTSQTIDRWFPDAANGSVITVNHLLTHTSGLPNFTLPAAALADFRYTPADAIIDAGVRAPPPWCAGSRFLYSNTGYILLSRIAEKVEQASFAQIVQARIARPLGLKRFRILEGGDSGANLVLPPELNARSIAQFVASHAGAGAAAGGTPDMLAILHAWLGGRLLAPAQRGQAASTLYPMQDETNVQRPEVAYGQGVLVINRSQTRWIGHTGGLPGCSAIVLYDVRRKTYLSLIMNRQEADNAGAAAAMLAALDQGGDEG